MSTTTEIESRDRELRRKLGLQLLRTVRDYVLVKEHVRERAAVQRTIDTLAPEESRPEPRTISQMLEALRETPFLLRMAGKLAGCIRWLLDDVTGSAAWRLAIIYLQVAEQARKDFGQTPDLVAAPHRQDLQRDFVDPHRRDLQHHVVDDGKKAAQ